MGFHVQELEYSLLRSITDDSVERLLIFNKLKCQQWNATYFGQTLSTRFNKESKVLKGIGLFLLTTNVGDLNSSK